MSDNSKKGKDDSEYKSTLKSMDTEETFDLIFYRPIGYRWALLAKRLGVTPNVITIASIFLGVGAGVAFYFNNFWINLLGVFLLVWADSFDSADGQLARMTKQYSRIGRILDGVSGDIWFAAIYVAICLRENVTSDFFSAHHWVIWVMAVVTGFCHATQAAMADYYRQFHLYFLKGEEGSELESAARLWERFHELSWKKNFWSKLTLAFYTNYTVGQEKRTPWMQKLRAALKARYGKVIPQSFRDAFREKSKPLMKYTNILSFNTRSFALFAAILIFQMPWLYFAFELTVLNIVLIYMVVRHEKICKDFVAELQK
ncbi:MAG: CDP-alcohol phosphatidyltransferase family protein [Muribaculaceae bacterium]|nr:CDP-alcohol phosphatidyltransferase family protein [Muribaculaceae bacterium]MDE6008716.1 CDP-alcohol phosphatidyltransferase family protein [Muribaculaceae bacterium]MDE6792478.1 CDP-alcohol phosphatidyltransferase family protein [Muribaculaceae bacterium]